MSLRSAGVRGNITTNTQEGDFKSHGYGSAKNKPAFIEAEKELFRNLLEDYLNSEQFKKDVYQLNSTINIKIERSVDLVMPNEG